MRSLRLECTKSVGNAFIRSVYNLCNSVLCYADLYGTDKSVPYGLGAIDFRSADLRSVPFLGTHCKVAIGDRRYGFETDKCVPYGWGAFGFRSADLRSAHFLGTHCKMAIGDRRYGFGTDKCVPYGWGAFGFRIADLRSAHFF